MIKAASLGIDIDLLGFSRFLQSSGVPHKITEESGMQVIWVADQQQAVYVEQKLSSWSFGKLAQAGGQGGGQGQGQGNLAHQGTTGRHQLANRLLGTFIASPITLSLILVCLLVALISELGSETSRVSWLFYPQLASDNVFALLADLMHLEFALRSLTPMFLHFGELHLVFNMLWLWYFGKQLEALHPAWLFMLLIIVTSFASNTTQYMASNYNNFGGMSGVVYGLVAYSWVIHNFMPRSYLLFNRNLFTFFIVALVVMELVASSWVATAAHVGGLIAGLLLAVVTVFYYRIILQREEISKS